MRVRRRPIIGVIACGLAVGGLVYALHSARPLAEQRRYEAQGEISELTGELRDRGYSGAYPIAVDVFVIRNLDKALESENFAEAARALWSPRSERPETYVNESSWSPSNFGATRERRTVRGESLSCILEWLEFRGRALEWRARCGHRLDPADELVREYRRHTDVLQLVEGELSAEGSAPEVRSAADAARGEQLGPMPSVEVPVALRGDFDVLTSRWQDVSVAGACGLRLVESEPHAAIRRIAEAERYDLLRAVLRGPNPGGRALAAISLLERDRATDEDRRTIKAVEQETPDVEGCSGCVVGTLESTTRLFAAADARGKQRPADQ